MNLNPPSFSIAQIRPSDACATVRQWSEAIFEVCFDVPLHSMNSHHLAMASLPSPPDAVSIRLEDNIKVTKEPFWTFLISWKGLFTILGWTNVRIIILRIRNIYITKYNNFCLTF